MGTTNGDNHGGRWPFDGLKFPMEEMRLPECRGPHRGAGLAFTHFSPHRAMFDHVKFGVSDYAASKAFFINALAPLGVEAGAEGEPSCGIELCGHNDVSLCLFQAQDKPAPLRIAFAAANRQEVDAFHRAALAAGARDNGAPGGLRPHYHAHYYAAFVIGPDGHNIEAVCHAPQP